MKKIVAKYLLVFYAALGSAFSQGAVLDINGGILFGASGVDVEGMLFDVQFLDGTCAGLFDGCDGNEDFTFSNPLNDATLLNQAMLALLDQVFIDSSLGAFDTNPALTNGCIVGVQCTVQTPLFVNVAGNGLGISAAVNRDVVLNAQVNSADRVTAGGGQRDFDTTNFQQFNPAADRIAYAVWSEATVVPVPAALWLFVSGAMMLLGAMRRSRA